MKLSQYLEREVEGAEAHDGPVGPLVQVET